MKLYIISSTTLNYDDLSKGIELIGENWQPIFLTGQQYQEGCENYAQAILWPLCHYITPSFPDSYNSTWISYKQMNIQFCEQICSFVQPEDWIWIQDYRFMLLPAMLRKIIPNLHIGYFHHIPFPSYELFRILPEREEILEGLLGADLLGFQTHEHMRHFISSTERILHLEYALDEVNIGNRIVRVDTIPTGIDYEFYHNTTKENDTCLDASAINIHTTQCISNLFGSQKLILSINNFKNLNNCTELSKHVNNSGILNQLHGYEHFLQLHPEYMGKSSLAIIITADNRDITLEVKKLIDNTIRAINEKWSTTNWTAVNYFCFDFSDIELTTFLNQAAVALVCPLRDGMNLLAKRYIATKNDKPAVLILSETSGAATELSDALLVNPNNEREIANAIYKALQMPEDEQIHRLHQMQAEVSKQTAEKWANDFADEWLEVVIKNQMMAQKLVTTSVSARINKDYQNAHKRLIILDYDGTLVPFCTKSDDAKPNVQIMKVLQRLAEDPKNQIVINSGRDHNTLEKWLGNLRLAFAAEHGAIIKNHGFWERQLPVQNWSNGLMAILIEFAEKTPKSHLEIKESGLTWHYQQTDGWLGELRANQLIQNLSQICQNQHLTIHKSHKSIVIKPIDCTKSSVINSFLKHNHYDFILAIGDDTTDDGMLKSLPHDAYSIKIGTASPNAQYNLTSQEDTLPFLLELLKGNDALTTKKARTESGSKRFFFWHLISLFKQYLIDSLNKRSLWHSTLSHLRLTILRDEKN